MVRSTATQVCEKPKLLIETTHCFGVPSAERHNVVGPVVNQPAVKFSQCAALSMLLLHSAQLLEPTTEYRPVAQDSQCPPASEYSPRAQP